jgi:hypothetical protein
MIARRMSAQPASSTTIEKCSAHLEELHEHIAHRFLRPEVRARAGPEGYNTFSTMPTGTPMRCARISGST